MHDREVRRMILGIIQCVVGAGMFLAGLALLLVKGC